MKIAVSKSHSPYINLATEEIILKDNNIKEDVILFYINKNTIVVGRNQNVHEEINHQYVADNKIKVIRRISVGELFTRILVISIFPLLLKRMTEVMKNF